MHRPKKQREMPRECTIVWQRKNSQHKIVKRNGHVLVKAARVDKDIPISQRA